MKRLITASDVRTTHAHSEQEMSVVLCVGIITPETREAAELLGVAISECDESAPTIIVPAMVGSDKTENQRICETIIAWLPEGQFIESLVVQLISKIMKEEQPLEQGGMQPSLSLVTSKGGVKVIDGSSVKFGRFNGAQPHCMGLTDLVTDQDGSGMAAGFMQRDNTSFPWMLNYDEIGMILEGELCVRHEGETMITKAGGMMFILKGSSIEFGMPSAVKFLYVVRPASWQSC